LNKIARENKVTPNIVVETVWGILLQKYNNSDDVVFGAVVSGRPPEIEGIEQMVGLFINTVPVRIKHQGKENFSQLLEIIQHNEAMSKSYEYFPLPTIQANSIFKQDLIDHIMAFENYPLQEMIRSVDVEKETRFRVEDSNIFEQSNYQLNVVFQPGEKLIGVKYHYNSLVYPTELVKKINLHLMEILEQVVENSSIELKDITISYELSVSKSHDLREEKGDFGF
jgi:non-ribosomal peptide synthetase component F